MGGAGSSGCEPPSTSLAALWRFFWRWAPSAGPCSDARFLPLPSPDRLSRSTATGDGASGASSSPGSRGRRNQPCMPLAAETCSVCNRLRMPGRVTYDPRPVGAPATPGWPVCPYWQQLATPWPLAQQHLHNGAPCVGQSPAVDPCPLHSPHREEGTPCVAAGCAALQLVDCSAGRASGQHGYRCARWYRRRGALPAGARGKNPPRISTMGIACSGLLSRRSHCVTQCAAEPSSSLFRSS